MIDLGATDFSIDVPSMPRDEFEKYSMRLFDEWEEYVEKTLSLPDYSLALDVEEGSVKGGGKIAVALTALYLGIGNYGSFISGVHAIRGQVSSTGTFLAERAAGYFSSPGLLPKVRKRGGSLAHLQRLFEKVQHGEINIQQAMQEAERLFSDDVGVPEFMQKLKESLEQAPRFPQQLPLLEDVQELEPSFQRGDNKRLPRPSSPKLGLPPPQQLRVEIRRESKNGKRSVRVIQL